MSPELFFAAYAVIGLIAALLVPYFAPTVKYESPAGAFILTVSCWPLFLALLVMGACGDVLHWVATRVGYRESEGGYYS